ncbi:hypothetical protein DPMN_125343 [Dreissena polymorpha]|uniref:Uncharacterized protein n=1 Tax=Dreissena polymorpha TaxID=45954 RepID=A0A9D4JTF1_DREPO|nr:hypothetical protein DPMN_125343 [Dreissena polymorpha]
MREAADSPQPLMFDWSPPGFGLKTSSSMQDKSRLSVSKARKSCPTEHLGTDKS